MESAAPDPSQSFSLRGRPRAVVLEAEGLHHPRSARGGRLVFTRYRDITHLATSPRALWIGSRRSVYVIPRRSFVDTHAPEHLVRALLEHIALQPGGTAQLAHMAQIEETARTPGGQRATWGLAALCVAVYALQWLGGDDVQNVGYFSGSLFSDGDWWRLVTANLLHAFSLHLVLNLLALLTIGALVERAIGTVRTLCVMVAAGLGSMLASGVASSLPVVGVSGVVFGLLGALLWLEFRFPEELPAWWRVPRRALFWMLGVSALLSLLPFIAGAAHAGGLVGGAGAAALLAWRMPARRPSPPWIRAVAAGLLAISCAAVGAAAYEVLREGEYAARYVARLGRLPDLSPDQLNDTAWTIAIDPESSPELLEAALQLAERAVEDSERSAPHILDTLAEVHFQLGDREAALAAIEEAILRAPGQDYYQEQRRRFLGERDSEDRPFFRPPGEPAPGSPSEPGITV